MESAEIPPGMWQSVVCGLNWGTLGIVWSHSRRSRFEVGICRSDRLDGDFPYSQLRKDLVEDDKHD